LFALRHAAAVRVRPLLVSRIANILPGTAVLVVGGGLSLDGPAALTGPGVVVSVLVGAVLAVRGYRLGVEAQDDDVVVHGLLRSRRALTAVTLFPALRWRDKRGRVRWTPVIAFADLNGSIAVVEKHNQKCIDRLEQLLRS
jgi:hypothetical protein